jgi:septum formation protein
MITETSKVYFKNLTQQEMDHYIKEASPLDKAGAYGIQEWIGDIGITQIEGSYTNVVGLPLAQVKDKIKLLVQEV